MYRSFYFDCDSTLTAVEGVDELTRVLPEGLQREIAALTAAAMNGDLPLAEVYERRLATIAPSKALLDTIGGIYVQQLVPGAREVVSTLQRRGKKVAIVSGGLLPVVRVLGAALGVPAADVHAVGIEFDAQGRYRGFDRSSPFWRNGGKREFFAGRPASERPIVFVGDGVTDLEAKDVVELFIGYGGVAVREKVRQAAAHFVLDLRDVLRIAQDTHDP